VVSSRAALVSARIGFAKLSRPGSRKQFDITATNTRRWVKELKEGLSKQYTQSQLVKLLPLVVPAVMGSVPVPYTFKVTVEQALNIQYDIGLSREKMIDLEHILFCIYDPDTGRWVRRPGASGIPGRHLRDQLADEICAHFSLQVSESRLEAHGDFITLLRDELEALANRPKLLALLAAGIDVLVQMLSDAANMLKGMKQTASGFKLPTVSPTPNSPVSNREFAAFEAGDGYDQYLKHGLESIRQIAAFIADPVVHDVDLGGVSKVSVRCRVIGGGDQPNQHAFLGVGGCNNNYPCCYCYAHKFHMCNISPRYKASLKARTLEEIAVLAHCSVGYCPGCERVLGVEDLVDLQNRTGVLKKPKGHTNHFGVVYGHNPFWWIPIEDWVLCILHANLCIVKGLWVRTILPLVDAADKESGGEETQAHALAVHLGSLGVPVEENKLGNCDRNGNVITMQDLLKSHSMHGRESETVLDAIEGILRILLPKGDGTSSNDIAYEKVVALWRAWRAVWVHLNSKFYDDGEGGVAREKYVAKYVTLIDTFVGLWVVQVGATQGLYLHLLVQHAPQQMKRFGNLAPFSVHGLEHNNNIRKKDFHKHTNCRKDQKKSRTYQVMRVQYVRSTVGKRYAVAKIIARERKQSYHTAWRRRKVQKFRATDLEMQEKT
jgi:hypothetical protein